MQEKNQGGILPRETLEAFGNDLFRARIFYDKYALRDRDGRVVERSPVEAWTRIARELAWMAPASKRRTLQSNFLWLLSDFRMVPGGRILHAVGSPHKATALNCYVLPSPRDSLKGIFHSAWELAETFKFGGGCGLDISSLRPMGSRVQNAARTSTGAVSFMELYSHVTGLIGQGGRRGALMLTLEDSHPDIGKFCRIKTNQERVRFANVSVKVTDAFMNAVAEDGQWRLRYTNPEDRIEIERVVQARLLWEAILAGARGFAEPGLLFWDTARRFSSSDQYPGMGVVSTNPCGEQPLEPYGDCCLGSLNLAAFVHNPFSPGAKVDFESLARATRLSVRMLDNVLTWNQGHHALSQQEAAAERGRRIGLGIMGAGDMLCELGMAYDSDEAIETMDGIMEKIKIWAYDESADLAAEKGPFPVFDPLAQLSNPFFKNFPPELREKVERSGLRNITLLTVAPTGSIAAMAGVTSGIEPIFALKYLRRSESLGESRFEIDHPLVSQYKRRHPQTASRPLPPQFVTAHAIAPEKRVRMQAACQKHVDQAISSTINLPQDCSVEQVGRLFRLAWELGLKGITVYREGSRAGILVTENEVQAERRRLSGVEDEFCPNCRQTSILAQEGCPRCAACGHREC